MTETTTDGGRGHFFAVDQRCWARACQLGLNAAVSYLVLARFTGRDNQTTKAGAQAIEAHTGISRPRAKASLAELQRAQLLTSREGITWKIVPACNVPGTSAHPRPTLTTYEQEVIEKIKQAGWIPKKDYVHVNAAVTKRHLIHTGAGYTVAPEPDPKPDWIWLPNHIVTGAADETPPLELLRQVGNVMTLRLFVDLYHVHSLCADGGIHWQRIRQTYHRKELGKRGGFTIWGFSRHTQEAWPSIAAPFITGKLEEKDGHKRDAGWPAFWDCWNHLQSLGLVELVPHLIEADTAEAEIIHPYGIGSGEQVERDLALVTHRIGRTLLTPAQIDRAQKLFDNMEISEQPIDGDILLAPVPMHMANVQMVGIARLRYRPRTSATGAWLADLHEKAEAMKARYAELLPAPQAAPSPRPQNAAQNVGQHEKEFERLFGDLVKKLRTNTAA